MSTLVSESNRVEDLPEGHSTMVILDSTGDTRHTWDRSNEDEVSTMREMFEKMVKKGYQAFSVKRGGDKGERIREFDPEAEKVIFAPALQGG